MYLSTFIPRLHYGLNRIYTREEIEKAKKSPSFEREYCLKFAGKIGNLLSHKGNRQFNFIR